MKRIFSKTIVKKTRGKQLKQKGGGGGGFLIGGFLNAK
jgi:hypothetical protein